MLRREQVCQTAYLTATSKYARTMLPNAPIPIHRETASTLPRTANRTTRSMVSVALRQLLHKDPWLIDGRCDNRERFRPILSTGQLSRLYGALLTLLGQWRRLLWCRVGRKWRRVLDKKQQRLYCKPRAGTRSLFCPC